MDQQQASQNVSSDTQKSASQHVPSQAKPRARLGPTEVVQLPASDSEPDDDEGNSQKAEAEEDGDPEFLKNYPDDTEVGSALVEHQHLSFADGSAGSSTVASPLENTSTRTPQLSQIWEPFEKIMSPSKRAYLTAAVRGVYQFGGTRRA